MSRRAPKVIDGLRSPLDAAQRFEEDPAAAAAFMREAEAAHAVNAAALAAIGETQTLPAPDPVATRFLFESDIKALRLLLKQERKNVVNGEVVTIPGIDVGFRDYQFGTTDEETVKLLLSHPKQGVGKMFWLASDMRNRVREAKKAELIQRITSNDELLNDPEVQAALRVRLGSEAFPAPPAIP